MNIDGRCVPAGDEVHHRGRFPFALLRRRRHRTPRRSGHSPKLTEKEYGGKKNANLKFARCCFLFHFSALANGTITFPHSQT